MFPGQPAACRGVPDIGVLTLADVADEAGRIARSVSIPTIVDADTGYGDPSVVCEAVRIFEEAGLAGMQIEDQEPAKSAATLRGNGSYRPVKWRRRLRRPREQRQTGIS